MIRIRFFGPGELIKKVFRAAQYKRPQWQETRYRRSSSGDKTGHARRVRENPEYPCRSADIAENRSQGHPSTNRTGKQKWRGANSAVAGNTTCWRQLCARLKIIHRRWLAAMDIFFFEFMEWERMEVGEMTGRPWSCGDDVLIGLLKERVISHGSGAHCSDSRTKPWKRHNCWGWCSRDSTSRPHCSSSCSSRSSNKSKWRRLFSYNKCSSRPNRHKVHLKPPGSRDSHSFSSWTWEHSTISKTVSGGEDQWQNWSWKIKTALSGTIGGTDECSRDGWSQKRQEDLERRRVCWCEQSVLAMYMNSEASTIVRSVTGLRRRGRDSTRTTAEEHWEEILRATWMRVPETIKWRESGEIGDHAVGGEMEIHDVWTRKRWKDPRHVANVVLWS